MSLLDLARSIESGEREDSIQFDRMAVKCSIQIDLKGFFVPKGPSIVWRAWHWGMDEDIFKTASSLLNGLSDAEGFWVFKLNTAGEKFTVEFYNRRADLTVPEFAKLVQKTLPVVFNSEEMKAVGANKFNENAILYDSIRLMPHEFHYTPTI